MLWSNNVIMSSNTSNNVIHVGVRVNLEITQLFSVSDIFN